MQLAWCGRGAANGKAPDLMSSQHIACSPSHLPDPACMLLQADTSQAGAHAGADASPADTALAMADGRPLPAANEPGQVSSTLPALQLEGSLRKLQPMLSALSMWCTCMSRKLRILLLTCTELERTVQAAAAEAAEQGAAQGKVDAWTTAALMVRADCAYKRHCLH